MNGCYVFGNLGFGSAVVNILAFADDILNIRYIKVVAVRGGLK